MSFIGRHNIRNASSNQDIFVVSPINLTYWDTNSDVAVRNASGNHVFIGTISDIRDCVKDYKALMFRNDSEIYAVLRINSSKDSVKDIQKFISRTYLPDLVTNVIETFDADVCTVSEFKKMM